MTQRGEGPTAPKRGMSGGNSGRGKFFMVIEIIMSEKIWKFGRGILGRGKSMYK